MKPQPPEIKYGKDADTGQIKPVMAGDFLFRLVDEQGFPFDLAIMELADKNLAFNVVGFCKAALKSWPVKRVYETLMASKPKSCPAAKIKKAIEIAFEESK